MTCAPKLCLVSCVSVPVQDEPDGVPSCPPVGLLRRRYLHAAAEGCLGVGTRSRLMADIWRKVPESLLGHTHLELFAVQLQEGCMYSVALGKGFPKQACMHLAGPRSSRYPGWGWTGALGPLFRVCQTKGF